MSDSIRATAARFFHEQNHARGGPPDEICAPGYTFRVGNMPAMDVEGHRAFSAPFYDAFSDLKHEIEEIIAEDERAAVMFRLRGTNDGDFMGNPPSGRSIDVGAVAFMTIASDKVADVRAQFDQMALMQQIGALPA